jgi:hypothetical protein
MSGYVALNEIEEDRIVTILATRHTPQARRRLLLNRQLHRGHVDDAFDFCRPRQHSLGPSSLPSARSSWGTVYNLDIHQRKRIHEK